MSKQLRALMQAKQDKEKALGALAQTVSAREGARYTDDERAQRTTLRAELLDLEAAIDDLSLSDSHARLAAQRERGLDRLQVGRGHEVRSLEQIEALFAYEPDPALRAQARREPRTNPLATHVVAGDVHFTGLGDYLNALRETALALHEGGRGTHRMDPRLGPWGAAGAGGEGVPTEGAALAQLYYSGALLERSWGGGLILSRCQEQGVGDGFDGVTLYAVDDASRAQGKRYGGIQVYWRESVKAPTTPTRPKLLKQELRVKPLSGYMRLPEETMRDAVALGEFALRVFPEEFRYAQEDAAVRGDGQGMPLGILEAPCLVVVAKKGGQAADSFVAENAIAMEGRFWPRNMASAGYYVNRGVLPQLRTMYLPTGASSGQLVYMPANGLSQTPYGTLGAYQVDVVEQCSKLGDKGDVVLADWSEYLLVRKRSGVAFAASAHIYFDTWEMAFRWEVWVNGQPIPSAPITPAHANAGETYSPFVVVADRA